MNACTHLVSSQSIPCMFSATTTTQFTTKSFKLSQKLPKYSHFEQNPCLRFSFMKPRCSVSTIAEASPKEGIQTKPSPAEISRTIMALCSVGTLSTVSQDGWPLGVGACFIVDEKGTPVLCLNDSILHHLIDTKCSLHVKLEQCGERTPQCTLQGNLKKPEDGLTLKRFHELWRKRFGEEVDENLLHVVSVEQIFHMPDFRVDGIWVKSPDYMSAIPDPLRNSAESLVNEMNSNHIEDVHRFCNTYVNSGFQVLDAKLIWVDRLGFDVHIYSQSGIYEARIPFPRAVTDERGAKSSFNCMSQLAWEVEKNYTAAEFEKVKDLKEIRCNRTEGTGRGR